MRELNLLASLAATGRLKRGRRLLVQDLQYEGTTGHWRTAEWAYAVPYAFREALDIRFLLRMEHKQEVMRWTQGPLLAFSAGDVLHRCDGSGCVQVVFARPMARGQSLAAHSLDPGYVGCHLCDGPAGDMQLAAFWEGTQLDFLRGLISGEWPNINPAQTD